MCVRSHTQAHKGSKDSKKKKENILEKIFQQTHSPCFISKEKEKKPLKKITISELCLSNLALGLSEEHQKQPYKTKTWDNQQAAPSGLVDKWPISEKSAFSEGSN